MNHALLALALLLATPAFAQSFVTWDGGGDGASFESSANWLQFDTFGPPPEGTFASGNVIGYHEVLIFAPLEVIDLNQNHKVNLGDGNMLTVTDAIVTAQYNTSFYPTTLGAGGSQAVILDGTTAFEYGWSWDTAWSLANTATLTAHNSNSNADSGILGKTSTLAFESLDSRYHTTAIDYTTVDPTSLLAKMTVLGAPAVAGENILITSDGAGGAFFTPVPEPSTASLALAATALCFRRKRSGDSVHRSTC